LSSAEAAWDDKKTAKEKEIKKSHIQLTSGEFLSRQLLPGATIREACERRQNSRCSLST
jgi:hypothetical protein